jgi:hypothetical protein
MVQEIRFGGTAALTESAAPGSGIASLPRTNEEFQQRYADRLERRPAWFKVLEAAMLQMRSTPEGRQTYGDPERGATLPQAWRTQFAMSGFFQVCLLARGRPSTPVDDIPQVVLIAPADLVAALARGFDEIHPFSAQLFVYDGRMGHSITAMGHDAQSGTFTYHDPWPDRSLLCREFNSAGVDAQPADDGLWTITDAELARVIFAAFVMPTAWAHLSGQQFRVDYAALQQTDFWKFFHLREAGRESAENGRTRVTVQPGGFKQELSLHLELDADERVRESSLGLRRGWVVGPPHGLNPFAVDIAKSFVGAFLPDPDRAEGEAYVQALRGLRADAQALFARREQPDLSLPEEFQLTYLGLRQSSTVLLPYCRIDAENAERNGEPWLTIEIDLY